MLIHALFYSDSTIRQTVSFVCGLHLLLFKKQGNTFAVRQSSEALTTYCVCSDNYNWKVVVRIFFKRTCMKIGLRVSIVVLY